MATLGTDSYVTSADYVAYCSTRGKIPGYATLEADLVLSADFINTYYALQDDYKLPMADLTLLPNIKMAALKAVELQQAGRLTIDFAAISVGVIKRERKKADVLEKEIEYQDGTASTFKPRVPELDLLLRPFLTAGAGVWKVLL